MIKALLEVIKFDERLEHNIGCFSNYFLFGHINYYPKEQGLKENITDS